MTFIYTFFDFFNRQTIGVEPNFLPLVGLFNKWQRYKWVNLRSVNSQFSSACPLDVSAFDNNVRRWQIIFLINLLG